MSERESDNPIDETIEATEPTAEAEQPDIAEPTEIPAAEPEPAEDEPAETEAEQVESPAAAAEPEGTVAAGAEATVPSADRPRKQRSRRHVPRSDRSRRAKPKRAAATAERKEIVRLPKPEHERGRRQERRGVVVSSAMDKTIVVKVDVMKIHPRYKKVIRRSQKFHAHDERNEANVGDVVRIVETRPLSKTKSWRLAEVVEAAR